MEFFEDILAFLIPIGFIVLVMIIIIFVTKLMSRWIYSKISEQHEEPTVHNDEDIYMESSLLDLNGADNYERKVKKITRYYTDIKEETVTKAGICYVINYNKNRKTEDLLEFDRKGKEISYLIYEYDKKTYLCI